MTSAHPLFVKCACHSFFFSFLFLSGSILFKIESLQSLIIRWLSLLLLYVGAPSWVPYFSIHETSLFPLTAWQSCLLNTTPHLLVENNNFGQTPFPFFTLLPPRSCDCRPFLPFSPLMDNDPIFLLIYSGGKRRCSRGIASSRTLFGLPSHRTSPFFHASCPHFRKQIVIIVTILRNYLLLDFSHVPFRLPTFFSSYPPIRFAPFFCLPLSKQSP